jgi:hypothetical protein
MAGGRWASTVGACALRTCDQAGDCLGPWLRPGVPCHDIRTGEPYSRVHFYLGNPTTVEGDTVEWVFGKPAGYEVAVTVRAGNVQEVTCPVGT